MNSDITLPWHLWRPVTVEIESQGSLLKMKTVSGFSSVKVPQSHQRGKVTQFSRKSRKRMLETIARLDRRKVSWGRHRPKFITLTYEENMTDHQKAKRDLKVFVERMQERYPEFACLWRKEQQERGAIHFHLMVFGTPWLLIHTDNSGMGWQQHWNEVCGNSPDNKNSFDIEVIDSMNGVAYYVAKYMAKSDNDDQPAVEQVENKDRIAEEKQHVNADGEKVCYSHYGQQCSFVMPPATCPVGLSIVHKFSQVSTGRWWGVYGRKHMPYAPKSKKCVTVPLATLDRWLQECVQSKWASLYRSWTVFRDDAPRRHDGIYKLMAKYMVIHEDYEYKRYAGKRFAIRNSRENSYAEPWLYNLMRTVERRNKEKLVSANIEMGVGPHGTEAPAFVFRAIATKRRTVEQPKIGIGGRNFVEFGGK